jgi:hypothetical protein
VSALVYAAAGAAMLLLVRSQWHAPSMTPAMRWSGVGIGVGCLLSAVIVVAWWF